MVLQVNNLSVRRGKEVDLRSMSFSVQAGECIVIRSQILLFGTTLLQSLLGLEEFVSGEVRFNEHDLVGEMSLPRRLELRRHIAYVHRVGGLISLLNVRENIALPLCYHAPVSRDEVERLTQAVTDALGIKDLLDREIDELDMMQTRLVNLARALINEPQLLLVDAILEGMNELQSQRVINTVNRYQDSAGFAVVMTARSREFPLADRVYKLTDDGLYPVVS